MLIGVLITDKKQTIPSTVPAATGPGTSPGGAHYSSSDVYVPPVKEEKGKSFFVCVCVCTCQALYPLPFLVT